MRSLGLALLICATPAVAAMRPGVSKPSVVEKPLLDKWIVRSVQRDGKPTPAQIGRKVGDIITIKRDGHDLLLS